MVVWVAAVGTGGNGPDPGYFEIWARLFWANGTPRTGEFEVDTADSTSLENSVTDDFQGGVSFDVAMDASGDFVIIWSNQYTDNGDLLEYHVYNANGTQKSDTQAITYNPANFFGAPGYGWAWGATTDSASPVVAMDNAGNFVIVAAARKTPMATMGCSASRSTPSATGPGNGITAVDLDKSVTENMAPSIAMTGNGSDVVVWAEPDTGQVLGQLFDSAGAETGGVFQINTELNPTINSNYWQPNYPAVAMDAAGAFVVTWTQQNSSSSNDQYAQSYDNAGDPVATPYKLTSGGTVELPFSGLNTAIAMDAAGNFVIDWADNRYNYRVGRHFRQWSALRRAVLYRAVLRELRLHRDSRPVRRRLGELLWQRPGGTLAFEPILDLSNNTEIVAQGTPFNDSVTIYDPVSSRWDIAVEYGDGNGYTENPTTSPTISLSRLYSAGDMSFP